jgi:hypothetical protein
MDRLDFLPCPSRLRTAPEGFLGAMFHRWWCLVCEHTWVGLWQALFPKVNPVQGSTAFGGNCTLRSSSVGLEGDS